MLIILDFIKNWKPKLVSKQNAYKDEKKKKDSDEI